MELHHAERSSTPSAAAHASPAAPDPDPDHNAPHGAASPAALTPAADDGPPAPVLCDSPAGVPSRRGLPMLDTADSAVLEQGTGLGLGLAHAAARPEDEATQTASAPHQLRQAPPERTWAGGSPDFDEELRPGASPLATAMQAGAKAEQQDAAGAAAGERHEALAADRLSAGLPTARRERAGVMLGQHKEVEGLVAHAPSQTASSCRAAEAGAIQRVPLAAAHGKAEAGAAEPEAASGARTAAGPVPAAILGSATAAAHVCGDATAAVSRGLSTLQEIALVTVDGAAAHGLVHAAAVPAMRGAASPALDSEDSGDASAMQVVHDGTMPSGGGLTGPTEPDPSPMPAAAAGGGCARASGHGGDCAHADCATNPAALRGPAVVQDALASGEPVLPEAGSYLNPQLTLCPTIPSLPGEDALVGGEPVTPPGLLAAMAVCGAGVGPLAAPAAGAGLCEGGAEAELPPLDSAGRQEVALWLSFLRLVVTT